jgi:hypothetical protein
VFSGVSRTAHLEDWLMPPHDELIQWCINVLIFGLLDVVIALAFWPIDNLERIKIMNLNETYEKINDLIDVELQTAVATESISTRQTRRDEIGKEISALRSQIATLNNRYQALPDLPPVYLVEWAKAVLQLVNLTFVVLDTTGVEDDSDIIRIYVVNREGKTVLDQLVMPERQHSANTLYTGISEEKLFLAYRLPEVWPRVHDVLRGRYVLSYNLNFVVNRLRENAEHYQLPGITLIGECLQNKARDYWGTYYPPKLTAICERIGHQLPQPATAPDRVAGQLALLRAMSQGITDVAPVAVGAAVEEAFEPEDDVF